MLIRTMVLALGTFAVGTAELFIAGILPLVANDLQISTSMAGQLVTVYALVFAFGGPLIMALSSHINPYKLLLGSLGIFITGNLVSIVFTDFYLVLFSRMLAACGSAVYTTLAFDCAASIAPAGKHGRSVSIIVAGWTLASIAGAPLGTLVGVTFGWRASFIFVIILSAGVALGIWTKFPRKIETPQVPGLKKQIAQLKRPELSLTIIISGLFLGGQYIAYTYLATFLKDVSGLGALAITFMLLVYGVSGTIGNLLGGYATDRFGGSRTLFTGIGLNALAMLGLSVVGSSSILVGFVILLWGLSSWSFTSAQQSRLIGMAPTATKLTLSLNLSFFNLGIAGGTSLGGMIINTAGPASLGLVGSLVITLAFSLTIITCLITRQTRTSKKNLGGNTSGAVVELTALPDHT